MAKRSAPPAASEPRPESGGSYIVEGGRLIQVDPPTADAGAAEPEPGTPDTEEVE